MRWPKVSGRLLSWVSKHVQRLQRSELCEARWEAAELVSGNFEIVQRIVLAEALLEAAELVLTHV